MRPTVAPLTALAAREYLAVLGFRAELLALASTGRCIAAPAARRFAGARRPSAFSA